MSDYTPELPHVGGVTDENGVTDQGTHRDRRIRTLGNGDRCAYSINEGPWQEGDWEDQHAATVAAMEEIDLAIINWHLWSEGASDVPPHDRTNREC